MHGSDAPEVDKTADHPEVVWDHLRDPEPYVPVYSPQPSHQQQQQQLGQQQYQCQQYQQPDQQHQQHQVLPGSQTSYPAGTLPQSSHGYAVEQSISSGSVADEKGAEPRPKATILGISRALFIALVVLTVIIIAAAIGGGVGGSMAVRSAYNDGAKGASNDLRAGAMSTSETSSAAAAAVSASTTAPSGASSTIGRFYTAPTAGVQLALDCPKLTGEKATIKYGSDYEASFTLACGLDKPGRGFDIFSATVYTYSDCMRLCVSYNRASHTKGCQGVSFGADLSDNVAKVYANCFLKNSTSDMSSSTDRFVFASLNS
ncbi:hypothetical protein PG999_003637 [Apiospora kogelbergensis]|uniref:PAN domain-containing protein n=1 Tax=Apiospora kogelbergensis TaxID=1337665 RepID=A0AAW0R467_9PEZI